MTVWFVTLCGLRERSRTQKVLSTSGGAGPLGRDARSRCSSVAGPLRSGFFSFFAAQSCGVRLLNLSHLFPLQPQRNVAPKQVAGEREPGALPPRHQVTEPGAPGPWFWNLSARFSAGRGAAAADPCLPGAAAVLSSAPLLLCGLNYGSFHLSSVRSGSVGEFVPPGGVWGGFVGD